VAWMFERKGTFAVSADAADEDTLMEAALEAGADDVELDEDTWEITCQVAAFSEVKEALAARRIETLSGEIAMVPNTMADVPEDKVSQVIHLIDALEDNDDVQNVYANFVPPEGATAG